MKVKGFFERDYPNALAMFRQTQNKLEMAESNTSSNKTLGQMLQKAREELDHLKANNNHRKNEAMNQKEDEIQALKATNASLTSELHKMVEIETNASQVQGHIEALEETMTLRDAEIDQLKKNLASASDAQVDQRNQAETAKENGDK